MDPAERIQLLTRALANYEELVSLVNGVLEAVTVTGAFPPARCEGVAVHRVVEKVLAQLDLRDVEAYTIRVQVAEQVQVWADPQFLHHVLQNLLSNIFKYVPTQTVIGIVATRRLLLLRCASVYKMLVLAFPPRSLLSSLRSLREKLLLNSTRL